MEKQQQGTDYFASSLSGQVGEMALKIADREAIIASQQQKIKELEEENEHLHSEKVKELDKQADEVKKDNAK